ncbi:hypothetical protein B5F07_10895 [Lachnoclostridium sp. An169]|uniref:DUF1294 domain-containing protein n=1 Tax=Lachnoclostridium sp. An169 TaxID=1965569 RepID=UPI000B39BE47|nr:DUF1294 domain-containing protein [Lachnoclostridium sp. An169]OUP83466.1 hypothetical protein B5F07_10895 [Lachnoclostridium sp. An169]
MRFLIWYLILINIITWIIYGLDKWKARRGKWRVPEKTLLLLALAGGSIGALAAMVMFHHKTHKARFYIGVPLILILECVIGAVVWWKLSA